MVMPAGPLDIAFSAPLQKSRAKGGWYYLIWPESVATFGTRGLVKVCGRIGDEPFESAFMAMGGGVHKLPVKKDVVRRRNLAEGDPVEIRLDARLS
jgi:hypothetical protein